MWQAVVFENAKQFPRGPFAMRAKGLPGARGIAVPDPVQHVAVMREGIIEQDESEMIQRVFRMNDVTAGELIMTARAPWFADEQNQ